MTQGLILKVWHYIIINHNNTELTQLLLGLILMAFTCVPGTHTEKLDTNINTLAERFQGNSTLFRRVQNENTQEPQNRERQIRLLPKTVAQHNPPYP